ncbi:hypothetical protein F9L07_01920 [Pimelobacter simplex]|uniref:Uncharacterized protein n=1 Tax=Nocardioides simplex TaxID=2045 RepID=A0A7J5DXU2_NOCSI|nr:hypothetical protein [Pimelobacter simplex]KAB2810737.1 hypothetical protein F9L07_01920 [Pimelobacter simplex]
MWLVVVTAVATFIATCLLKVLDVLVEGRGSWARRAIRADVDLLVALPESVRDGLAGQALTRRIETALARFGDVAEIAEGSTAEGLPDDGEVPSRPEVRSAESEAVRRAAFRREVQTADIRLFACIAAGLGLAAVVAMVVVTNLADHRGGSPQVQNILAVAVLFGLSALMVPVSWLTTWLAPKRVERRWRDDGEALPAPTTDAVKVHPERAQRRRPPGGERRGAG